jgi:dephospho-CoA kinase
MLRVGLTGSIAVGKSHVSKLLAKFGCHVLDADQTAREVVAPGTQGLAEIVAAFGPEVLRDDGTLDRARLGAVVFADEQARLRLNALLHPLIMRAQDEWLSACAAADPQGIGVIDAALMIESGGYRRFDKLIVVHCRPEVQLERLMRRERLTREAAEQRIAAQMSQAEKMRYADFLIDTSGDYAETRTRTRTVYEQLRALAQMRES